MDQSILTILGNSGNLGVVALIAMQGYQMFLDAQKAQNHKQIQDFQTQINELIQKHAKNEAKIEGLEKEVFELRRENAELRGLLEAQENKEELTKKFVKKHEK
jgi:septal ring factor EnvC (AmiA/AmiB activator)